jgi:carboxyl-terminal processing protease
MKLFKIILGVFLALALLTGTFAAGVGVGWLLPGSPISQSAVPTELPPTEAAEESPTTPAESPSAPTEAPLAPTETPSDLETLFAPFWQTWDLVHSDYVVQPVDDVTLMRGAIEGMLASLGDKHTSYMDPDLFKQANADLEGEYEGIGAWVDTTGEYMVIVSPIPDTPAEKAGLKPGDKIIAVDGEDVIGMDGSLVLKRVLGPAGTLVTLTILREGVAEPLVFEITRAKITIKSVTGEMLENDIAYVSINRFGDTTTEELRSLLDDLLSQDPVGLILDLRNNGGGYVTTCVEVASEFIKEGVVLYEEYGDGSRSSLDVIPGGMATGIPLVVLVNEGTASASEITAGAIQDYQRGILVGVVTYGKGSVQTWTELDDNQGGIRITIARWLTPNGRQINEIGITPDVIVEMTEEDYKAGLDPQLDKAIELLLK